VAVTYERWPSRTGRSIEVAIPDWSRRRCVKGGGVTLVEVRADSSVCPCSTRISWAGFG